ncbi:MAG: two-component system chemotaxis family sensor kinase [Geobacteraceae bacterium]|nr:MAG: two-component system chemotaxis family sensor kinase [Geobacteraceae bacterium]
MPDKSKYLDIFLKEAEEHLAALQKGLLILERNPETPALIHDLLRSAHTLKGSARMLGFDGISAIAHKMEDLLLGMEEGRKAPDTGNIDLLLQGSDTIARITGALARGEESPVDLEKFLTAFERGECQVYAVKELPKPEEALGDTIRAKVKTLDSVVNLIGEMIISRKRFEEKVSYLKGLCQSADTPLPVDSLQEFQRGLEADVLYLDYLIQELHGEAIALRMLPLSTITEGFTRMVRDQAKAQGKEVKLEVVGGTIEVDRVLLEILKPMLLHILTNAVDHGIEPPDERLSRGKPSQGTVRITARHEGSSVRIDIRDDGRGMDPERIKQAALRKGVIEKEEAELLRGNEALYLVLRPGFSTSEIVTDLSGRGVGMEVVEKNLEKVKGNLLLKSEVGSFSEITLHLPLTLSVIEALMISCCGECYALPLTYVQETIKIRDEDITTVGGKEVISLRGATIPLVSLSTLLGLPEKKTLLESGKIAAAVLKLRDQSLACAIDTNHGSSEIVVKGLGGQLKSVEYVSGATILGDGAPALILNVPDIFANAEGVGTVGFRKAFAESEAARLKGNILVVDDSITTRTMERSILIAHGYQVEVAISGEDALGKVAVARFDLVVSDIEMPGMDGFELTKKLRAMDEYREVPVVIVSSRSRDEDKRRAIEAGAQAYIVKGSFDQGALLDTVEALIG